MQGGSASTRRGVRAVLGPSAVQWTQERIRIKDVLSRRYPPSPTSKSSERIFLRRLRRHCFVCFADEKIFGAQNFQTPVGEKEDQRAVNILRF